MCSLQGYTLRTYHRFPLRDVDLPGRADVPILFDLARVAGWEPCSLRDVCNTCFVVWICTMQILHNFSQQQVRN